MFEVWKREYDTFDSGERFLFCYCESREVAEAIVASAGWGTDFDIVEQYVDLTPPVFTGDLDYFNTNHVVSYGEVYDIDSDMGQHLVQERNRENAKQAERNRIRALKPIGKKKATGHVES